MLPELNERVRKFRVKVLFIDLRWGLVKGGNALVASLVAAEACKPWIIHLASARHGWDMDTSRGKPYPVPRFRRSAAGSKSGTALTAGSSESEGTRLGRLCFGRVIWWRWFRRSSVDVELASARQQEEDRVDRDAAMHRHGADAAPSERAFYLLEDVEREAAGGGADDAGILEG